MFRKCTLLNNNFLEHTDPEDQIMEDRAFLIREEMMRHAELIILPAAKGAQQMSAGVV